MKKIYSTLFILLAVLFASCSKDTDSNPNMDGSIAVNMKLKGISQQLSRSVADTEAESTVNTIDLYLFSEGVLKQIVNLNSSDLTPAGNDSYTARFYVEEVGTYTFEAIVNLTGLNLALESSYDSFKETVTTAAASSPFVMRGYVEDLPVIVNGENPMSMDLVRLAARIDFANNAENFTLASACLMNAVTSSYIVPQATNPDTKADQDWVVLSNYDDAQPVAKKEIAYSQMYTYENKTAGDTYVMVSGTYKGASYEAVIPFDGIAIARNHRYLINITNITTTDVEFEITVSDWDEGVNVPFRPEDGKGLRVTVATDEEEDLHSVEGMNPALYGDDALEEPIVVRVATESPYVLNFKTESSNIETEIVLASDVDWLSISSVDTRAEYLMIQNFTLTLTENEDEEERSAFVIVRSKLDDKIAIKYEIVQEPKPIDYDYLVVTVAEEEADDHSVATNPAVYGEDFVEPIVITIESSDAYDLLFNVLCNQDAAIITMTADADWVTISEIIPSASEGQDFRVALGENSDTQAPRSTTIKVYNTEKEEVSITYVIIQAKAEDQGLVDESRDASETYLARFAKANLKEVLISKIGNTYSYEVFIPESHSGETFPKITSESQTSHPQHLSLSGYGYQWGRNSGFMNSIVNNSYIEDVQMPPYANGNYPYPVPYYGYTEYYAYSGAPWSYANQTSPYVFIATTGRDYLNNTYANNTKWENRGYEHDGGNKENCPNGYHIPTIDEWRAIMPTTTVKSTVSYTSATRNIVATEIKDQGTEDAVAMQWGFETRYWNYGTVNKYFSHLIIISVPVKASVTLDDVLEDVTENPSTNIFETAPNRVMRNFPATGLRNNTGKTTDSGVSGYYWASTSTLSVGTETGAHANALVFGRGANSGVTNGFGIKAMNVRRVGASTVRCMKDAATPAQRSLLNSSSNYTYEVEISEEDIENVPNDLNTLSEVISAE